MCPVLFILFAAACKPSIEGELIGTVDDDTGTTDTGDADDTGETEEDEPDYSEWDEASLVILSPLSASFLPLDQDADFEAIVYDADGNETDWDDISWTSDIDTNWNANGKRFEDDALDAGTHALSAVARLPNGDRLAYTVGGVLVQHEDAGTYTGEMNVDITIEYDGTEYIVSCFGAATLIIDIYGETGTGDSGCTVSLQGYDMSANHVFDFEIDDGEVGGEAAMDFDWFEYGFQAGGEVGDGELSATWADDVAGYMGVNGELDVTRISRDTSYGE